MKGFLKEVSCFLVITLFTLFSFGCSDSSAKSEEQAGYEEEIEFTEATTVSDTTEKVEKTTKATTRVESTEDKEDTEDFVSEESPLTYVYDDNENIVGNCSIVLKKIEIVNTPFKSYGSSSYTKHIRVQATVKNTSSQETYLTSKKDGQFYIGKYYGTTETTNIGWNNNYKWKVDSSIKADFGWTLKPNETSDICITGVFTDSDRIKYSDAPKIDLYFVNDNETLTITIN